MKNTQFDEIRPDGRIATGSGEQVCGVDHFPTYQAFLAKALALGTDEALHARCARRAKLLKMLKPVDMLARTGVAVRAGALALFWSPLLYATPAVYRDLGVGGLVFDSLLPAALVTAILFSLVKSLRESEWRPIVPGTEESRELEQTVSRLDETRNLAEEIARSGRSLYMADLTLLKQYNRQRQAELLQQ